MLFHSCTFSKGKRASALSECLLWRPITVDAELHDIAKLEEMWRLLSEPDSRRRPGRDDTACDMRESVGLADVFGVLAGNHAGLDLLICFGGVARYFDVVVWPADSGRAARPARRVFEKVFMVIVVFRRSSWL
jgi:hypothetical protein